MGWGPEGIRGWVDQRMQGGGNSRLPPGGRGGGIIRDYDGKPSPWWQKIVAAIDPHTEMLRDAGRPHMSTVLGLVDGWPVYTYPQSSALVIGPPRTSGKSAGVLIPQIMFATGPLIVVSTKPDLMLATAAMRSRMGPVLEFSPTGDYHLDGIYKWGYSPVWGCADFGAALERSHRIVQATLMSQRGKSGGTENAAHFQLRAGQLLAGMLHWADTGKGGYSMTDIMQIIGAFDIDAVEDVAMSLDSPIAQAALMGVVRSDSRERSGVFATAQAALGAYFHPGALEVASAESDRGLVAEFPEPIPELAPMFAHPRTPDQWRMAEQHIYGQIECQYVTLYVVADHSSVTAPIVSDLLYALAESTFARHERYPDSQPTQLILDELAYLPTPDLPGWLAWGGSRGLLISAAVQDLAQASVRWGDEAKAFPTLFNNILACRGIRDLETLKLLSQLAGKRERRYETTSTSYNMGRTPGRTESWQEHREWIEWLPPDEIYRGNVKMPHGMLWFSAVGGWGWVDQMRYFDHDPLTKVIMESARVSWAHSRQSLEGPSIPRGFAESRWPEMWREYAAGKHLVINPASARPSLPGPRIPGLKPESNQYPSAWAIQEGAVLDE